MRVNKGFTLTGLCILEITTLAKQNPQNTKHAHNTRLGRDLDIKQHRLKSTGDIPSVMGPQILNKTTVPTHLKATNCSKAFNKSLKTNLLAKPYYNLTELFNEYHINTGHTHRLLTKPHPHPFITPLL